MDPLRCLELHVGAAHFDYLQQEFGTDWVVESPGTTELQCLAPLARTFVETVIEGDGKWGRQKKIQCITLKRCPASAIAPVCSCVPLFLYDFPRQEPCLPFLKNSQSPSNSFRYMMRLENYLELIPIDAAGFFMGS
jgi:hypothetical protein